VTAGRASKTTDPGIFKGTVMLYPTTQPITNANLEAFLAANIARRFPNGLPARAAEVKLRVKAFSPAAETMIVTRMADDMRHFGEGMTHRDLRRAGYSADQIRHCAEKASARALALSNPN
jgi:hypothetical protein